ncbi:hypothetical protein CLAIMM_14607 [Cladophialophora immunda]|nr:hypothetical protein CLAIMM_14607 [Cladophialophora immunda]
MVDCTNDASRPALRERIQYKHTLEVDVLIVGGGMSGMYSMWKFRKLHLSVKLFEAGSYFGGAWYWNKYPGARVDSETPYYGLSIPEVYRTWSYTERFPGHVELKGYFAHVDKTLDLAKDAHFNTVVTGAEFDPVYATWSVQTDTGVEAKCKYLIMAVGSTYKMHIPHFKNMVRYQGVLFHSARCPDHLDVTGKKIACIGSGATGVQIIQALAQKNCEVHAYIRTPCIGLPMNQRQMSKDEQDRDRYSYSSLYDRAKRTKSGFPYDPAQHSFWDMSPKERESLWETLWERGGIHVLVSNFPEILTDKSANQSMYKFWAEKVRPRINDPIKRDILAPLKQRYYFGTKRPSLEDNYYEFIDQANVTIIDLTTTSIEEFTETGIALSDRHEAYDIIILATGYDSVTGSLNEMDLTDVNGKRLRDKWAKGTYTYLGLTIDGFPNMFTIYGPQSPISFSNAPPVIETQVDWVAAAVKKMRDEGIAYIDAQQDAAEAWRQHIQDLSDQTLYPETDSWYMGANVPGKPREQLSYLGGLDTYAATTKRTLDKWAGFDIFKKTSDIEIKQAGYLYGPAVAGGPSFPAGPLGLAKLASDLNEVLLDEAPILTAIATDTTLSASQNNSLQTLDDYTLLYEGQWKETLPSGPVPGILTNYTQDLLFSMERLSLSPYQVKRLNPAADRLQFTVEDSLIVNISGMTLHQLFQAGRLFYADYRDQRDLTPTDRYAAACDAFFYINQESGDFLPLAIRTNVGSNLVYTPRDEPTDWLLAKIMYNVNDFWFTQWNHLAGTHEVIQIVYLAALRTLSDEHPVLVLLNRILYEVYAIPPLANLLLFLPGTAVDQVFPYTGAAAQDYTTNLYKNNGSGRFYANYFTIDLESRGLINSNFGPPLKDFPFYDDAVTIYNAIYNFTTSFVNSYYIEDSDIVADGEIQAWVQESQGPAEAIDFPTITTRSALIGVISHITHLASTAHHTVNTNELISASSTLPFHPPSLYRPPPLSKGSTNIVDFLPPLIKVQEQFSFAALFTRPFFVNTSRALTHMFDDPLMLSRMNNATEVAAAAFYRSMQAFSREVAARTFDPNGLSQGMPFVWQALDPNVAPFSITS